MSKLMQNDAKVSIERYTNVKAVSKVGSLKNCHFLY